ncbi:MAG: ribonuclease Z [Thermoproteota archaeon]|nr:ribonuclease Z [Thermoproteota archaeon]
MSLNVIFLGTAGSVPTPKRSLPGIAIQRKGELIMLDCGEGIQRQMIQAKIGFHKKMKIFVTHMHGDHVLGLPGILQTMSLMDRKKELKVYGPPGIQAFVDAIQRTVQFVLTFPLKIFEIEDEGIVYEEKEYEVYAIWADHVIPSLAYSLVEKPRPGEFHPERAKKLGVPEGPLWGKLQNGSVVKLPNDRMVKPEQVMGAPRPGRKIVYTGDTRVFNGLIKFAENADLLIHDGTFDDELSERALEDGHSTPSQAAEIAKKAKVKKLILTHISARYRNPNVLLEQAKKVFSAVDVAEDFMKLSIPLKKD